MREIKNQTSFEGELVEYYEDFFYGTPEKCAEVFEWMRYIGNYVNLEDKKVFDIGCGTGIFEEALSSKAKKVMAIDMSEDMVKYAALHHCFANVEYGVRNICQNVMDERYDVAVSMSHVIGYQLDNKQLNAFLKNINQCLQMNGYFIFNFYHAPAVFFDSKLSPQFKVSAKDEVTISRISNARPDLMKNVLKLDYRYFIERKNDEVMTIAIKEEMRCFNILELENYLNYYGFQMEVTNVFMKDEDLSEKEWNGFIVARKISEYKDLGERA